MLEETIAAKEDLETCSAKVARLLASAALSVSVVSRSTPADKMKKQLDLTRSYVTSKLRVKIDDLPATLLGRMSAVDKHAKDSATTDASSASGAKEQGKSAGSTDAAPLASKGAPEPPSKKPKLLKKKSCVF